jgi:hypothetical protein
MWAAERVLYSLASFVKILTGRSLPFIKEDDVVIEQENLLEH